MYSMYGAGILVAVLIYLILAALAFGLLYVCIRFAVLAALKAHTQWLQAGGSAGPHLPPPPGPVAPARPTDPPYRG